MCSFYVTSLFMNVPLDETIDIAIKTLFHDETITKPTIPEDLFRKLIKRATTEVEFTFNRKMYKQTDGVAMGCPLGPVLANIFMEYCGDRISKEHMPLFYNRYVDDTFALF